MQTVKAFLDLKACFSGNVNYLCTQLGISQNKHRPHYFFTYSLRLLQLLIGGISWKVSQIEKDALFDLK